MTEIAHYHTHPEIFAMQSTIIDARPGLVRLDKSPFYPGGGGQLPDQGILRSAQGNHGILSFEMIDEALWIRLEDETAILSGEVEAIVDQPFRQSMRELHTGTHILNALVFAAFNGALVTGAQLGADGTARIDFDLPDADNDAIRALEEPLNDIIRQDLAIETRFVSLEEAVQEQGLIRSKSVAPPPTTDGRIRIVDIVGLDRQACGGTHLPSTGASRRMRIQKVENKGRHNRRVRLAITG